MATSIALHEHPAVNEAGDCCKGEVEVDHAVEDPRKPLLSSSSHSSASSAFTRAVSDLSVREQRVLIVLAWFLAIVTVVGWILYFAQLSRFNSTDRTIHPAVVIGVTLTICTICSIWQVIVSHSPGLAMSVFARLVLFLPALTCIGAIVIRDLIVYVVLFSILTAGQLAWGFFVLIRTFSSHGGAPSYTDV